MVNTDSDDTNAHLNMNEPSGAIVNSKKSALFQPPRLLTAFLKHVVKGNQITANNMLRKHPELLLKIGDVTDFSGRTFKNITAYEYAYWAMDTHMCRMLEAHMDEGTKAEILVRCEKIERGGLSYEQGGVDKNHKHFDFEPLITAYTQYIAAWYSLNTGQGSYGAAKAAWMAVGIAQRDVPVHVINEYCRRDRPFHPLPSFEVNGDTLPRDVTYFDYRVRHDMAIFPLTPSNYSGLGIDFALSRAGGNAAGGEARTWPRGGAAGGTLDLAACSRLNEVRTADVKQSLDILGKLAEPEQGE